MNQAAVRISTSEPFYWMARSHGSLNRRLKMSFMSFRLLDSFLSDSSEESLTSLIEQASTYWTRDFRKEDAAEHASGAKRMISELGVAAAYSAFDHYLTGIAGEIDRWSARGEPFFGEGEAPDADPGEDAKAGFGRLKRWAEKVIELEPMLPILEFFIAVRNAAVHRSGNISKVLEIKASETRLLDSLEQWPRRKSRPLPGLPSFKAGENLRLSPEHSLLASDVFLKAAKAIDSFVCGNILEFDGIVNMAAYHVFKSPEPVIDCTLHRSADRAVLWVLTDRYHTQTDSIEVISSMRRTETWQECFRAFVRKKAMLGG
jgi:hypothetical protein